MNSEEVKSKPLHSTVFSQAELDRCDRRDERLRRIVEQRYGKEAASQAKRLP